ncbi:type IV pilus twitching motility protein PilT [Cysteiniphilum sp. JM-1]|uniref:type IV pilus twitching motility protein PilT n=1 Tax=Cysteiniphilum sp. JM-1 TaxID=2610891 RepID=UPI0012441034|nr:ATPase, T2SS/T4P/T4SS family [Cysteiniphilum sp. JM-1]
MDDIKLFKIHYFTESDLADILSFYATKPISDIHFQVNSPIKVRSKGLLLSITDKPLFHQEMIDIVNALYGSNGFAEILKGNELDFSYSLKLFDSSVVRYRVNITACNGDFNTSGQITMRLIQNSIPQLTQLVVEDDLRQILVKHKGLVIIAGSTGSGKSTLLASALEYRMQTEACKVVTYEAPIEYTFSPKRTDSIITQSEVPKHIQSFESGIRNAMRRDPDVIMVGETRDLDTLLALLNAAITGHAVCTTMHSQGVVDTFSRIKHLLGDDRLAIFDLIRSLDAIVWQKLIRTKSGSYEAIREYLILDERTKTLVVDALQKNDLNLLDILLKEKNTHRQNKIENLISRGELDNSLYI